LTFISLNVIGQRKLVAGTFRQREALKKGKITDPEREIIEFDYDKIFYMDMKDFKKAEKEDKLKSKEAVKPKK
jgi:inosine/xanthosine triphosphate pyrophosphatase family protein